MKSSAEVPAMPDVQEFPKMMRTSCWPSPFQSEKDTTAPAG